LIHSPECGVRQDVADAYRRWHDLNRELALCIRMKQKKFQLVDILKFQIDELGTDELLSMKDERLEEERRRCITLRAHSSLHGKLMA